MKQRPGNGALWLPVPTAARYYSGFISERQLRRLAAQCILRSRRVGRCLDIYAPALHRYMNGLRREGA